jgi:hypothetical protein
MKTIALFAALLAVSTTPAFSVCKHHAAALVSVSDMNSPAANAPVAFEEIKKCMPHCGG